MSRTPPAHRRPLASRSKELCLGLAMEDSEVPVEQTPRLTTATLPLPRKRAMEGEAYTRPKSHSVGTASPHSILWE